jgi:hypothetical protein
LKEDEELLLMSTYPILDPAPSHAAPVPYAPVSAEADLTDDLFCFAVAEALAVCSATPDGVGLCLELVIGSVKRSHPK